MKGLIVLVLLDLGTPPPTDGLLGRTLWVLQGHYSHGHYWASAGTLHAALTWALSGQPAEGSPQAVAARILDQQQGKGFTRYDPERVRAAFRALYVPPTARIGGRLARDLYRPLRGFVAEAAQATACMLKDPAKLDRIARRYRARGRFVDQDWAVFDCVDPFSLVTAGVVLRRRLDGTLPVLVEALRTVLRDYDPETFAEVDRDLR